VSCAHAQGEGCPNLKCDTRAHFHCLRRYSEGKGRGKGKLKCPACTLEWTPGQGKTGGPAPRSISSNSSSTSSSTKKRRSIAQSDDEGEEVVGEQVDGEEEEEMAEED
jgi:hypothetical protein